MTDEDPTEAVYVIQRHPQPDKGYTYFHIWVKDDGMVIGSSELSQLLANVLQSQIKPTKATDLSSEHQTSKRASHDR